MLLWYAETLTANIMPNNMRAWSLSIKTMKKRSWECLSSLKIHHHQWTFIRRDSGRNVHGRGDAFKFYSPCVLITLTDVLPRSLINHLMLPWKVKLQVTMLNALKPWRRRPFHWIYIVKDNVRRQLNNIYYSLAVCRHFKCYILYLKPTNCPTLFNAAPFLFSPSKTDISFTCIYPEKHLKAPCIHCMLSWLST